LYIRLTEHFYGNKLLGEISLVSEKA